MNIGMSQSSMTGMSSWGISSTIFMDFSKIALGARYSKNETNSQGQLEAVHTFSNTYFTDFKNHMMFAAYTYVQPIDKLITGHNVSFNSTFLSTGQFSLSPSIISFAMYPLQIKRKTIIPDLFIISSPYGYSFSTKTGLRDRNLMFLTGFATDFKLTRKFKVNVNFKVNFSTNKEMPMLGSFMIGSRVNL
jgi:hypothetical protein